MIAARLTHDYGHRKSYDDDIVEDDSNYRGTETDPSWRKSFVLVSVYGIERVDVEGATT